MPKRKSKQSKITKLCPAFMTGGGGENFETHVAAVFVLSLLIDGLSPIVEIPIQPFFCIFEKCCYEAEGSRDIYSKGTMKIHFPGYRERTMGYVY